MGLWENGKRIKWLTQEELEQLNYIDDQVNDMQPQDHDVND